MKTVDERDLHKLAKEEAAFWEHECRSSLGFGGYANIDARMRGGAARPSRFPKLLTRNHFDVLSLLRFAAENAPMRVLDLACGPGWLSLELSRAGCDVLGVDVSEYVLEVARRRAEEQFKDWDKLDHGKFGIPLDRSKVRVPRYQWMDLNEPQFERDAYDLVSASGALHHVVKIEQLFVAVRNCLKPGGHFIFTDDLGTGRLSRAVIGVTRWIRGVDFEESPFEGQCHDLEGLSRQYFQVLDLHAHTVLEYRIVRHLNRLKNRYPHSFACHQACLAVQCAVRAFDRCAIATRIARPESIYAHLRKDAEGT